ncbi:hypothetical protein [Micromonospora maritima]|uniref:hypothetical protein n=1 Tax=Micromonospora maritima TaxID=986711 RepID=UPI00379B36D2
MSGRRVAVVGRRAGERPGARCTPAARPREFQHRRGGRRYTDADVAATLALGIQLGSQRPALGRGPALDPRAMSEPELMAALAQAYELGRETAEREACGQDLLVFLSGYATAADPGGPGGDERLWAAYLAGREGRDLPDAQAGAEAAGPSVAGETDAAGGDVDEEGGPRR